MKVRGLIFALWLGMLAGLTIVGTDDSPRQLHVINGRVCMTLQDGATLRTAC